MLASMASSSLIPRAENSRKTREANNVDSNKMSENLIPQEKHRINVCFIRSANLNCVGFEEIPLESLSVG